MRKSLALIGLTLLLLTACNLAGDVTPPPALATQQAFQPEPTVPPSTSVAVDETESIAVISPPEQAPDLIKGELIYGEKCALCHGDRGLGDGLMAGDLEITPAQLGASEIARIAAPAEWYEIVTDGRINRFMPPFSSLSDTERWDVVGYALSLSTPQSDIDRGKKLYIDLCADCHGTEGEKVQGGVAISEPSFIATRSLEDMSEVILNGRDTMPAFQGLIDDDVPWALGAYIRSLAYGGERSEGVVEVDRQGEILGSINGTVTTGTTEMTPPKNLEVTLLAFDGDQLVLTETTATDGLGGFEFTDLEIVPGRIFGAFIEYEGVRYYSPAVHFIEETSVLDLPIVVYASTRNQDNLEVERVHLVFDYSVEDLVDVSELWLISNIGDETILGGEGGLEIPLPQGYQNLRLTDASTFAELSMSDDSVFLQDPVLPGASLDLVFSFTLPYERSREFRQPMTVPVGAIVILTDEESPEISGEGIEDQGVRDMGGVRFRTYGVEPSAAEEELAFDLSGRHPAPGSTTGSTSLVISVGVLGLALVLVGVGWRYAGSRSDAKGGEPDTEPDTSRDKGTLLRAIAALDDAFESGDISEEEYHNRRTALKHEVAEIMKSEND